MVSWLHFLKEFNLHLVDLTFVPKVYKGVQMDLRGIDESVYPMIAPKLLGEVLWEPQGPTTIYIDGSKTEGLIGFGIFLDDMDSYRFRLPGHCGILHISCGYPRKRTGRCTGKGEINFLNFVSRPSWTDHC
jgi:hypothetical protein